MTDASFIPVLRPQLPRTSEILPYFERIDLSGIYSNFGPLVRELESRIADYVGVGPEHVVVLSSATSALEGALYYQRRQGNIDWALPSWTFTATASAAARSEVNMAFIDVDRDSWRVRKNSGHENIIDVLPFGDRLGSLDYSEHFQSVIIDGAASFLSLQDCGRDLKNNTGLVVSLHATKTLGAGEGGVFISPNHEWVAAVRSWSNFGFDAHKESVVAGCNAKMSEYSAAVALASLDALERTVTQWSAQMENASRLSHQFGFETSPALAGRLLTPYWILKLASAQEREELQAVLSAWNIEHRQWWGTGCHTMAAYADIPCEELTVTHHLSDTTLALPRHLLLSATDWVQIENALSEFISANQRAN